MSSRSEDLVGIMSGDLLLVTACEVLRSVGHEELTSEIDDRYDCSVRAETEQ